ncbi:MAG: hypothetical protein ACYDDI_08400 [Candidatus Acidiferrales bacterium]
MKRLVKRPWKKSLGPGQPEIAVLRLADEEYKEFAKGPINYLEERRVFKAQLNRVVRCGVKPNTKSAAWWLVIEHVPESTAFYIAWQMK